MVRQLMSAGHYLELGAEDLVPCLRRATAVDYTDADEDAEKLLSFLDEVGMSEAQR